MNNVDYEEIESFIVKKLSNKSKYIICPYGNVGKRVEQILLNKGTSKSDIVIVDNGLSSINKEILSTKNISYVYDSNSIILLCSLSYSSELIKEIKSYINDPYIINVFTLKISFIKRLIALYEKSFLSKVTILFKFYLNKILNKFFYTSSNKNIAVFLDGGLGDAVILSGVIDNLKKNNYDIYFFCLAHYSDFFDTARCKDKYYKIDFKSNFVKFFDETGTEINRPSLLFDSVIIPIDIAEHKYRALSFASKLKYKNLIGLNSKFFWSYDIDIKPIYSSHVTRQLYEIQKLFIDNSVYSEYRYSLDLVQSCVDYANKLFNKLNPKKKKTIMINCRTSKDCRCISQETLELILEDLRPKKNEYEIILTNCNFNINEIVDDNIHYVSFTHFGEVCSFISLVDYLITPDTSLIHVGCIYNTKAICLYNNRLYNNCIANNILFGPGPFYENAIQVLTDEYSETENGDDIRQINYKNIRRALYISHIL